MKKSIGINSLLINFIFLLVFISTTSAQTTGSWLNPDTVKAQRFDTGKMWTFEYPPLDYLEATYGFRPTQEWLEDVRLSSMRITNACSSGFVSEDGLLLTNHHCVDGILESIQQEGEDIAKNGFYAATLEDERRVDGFYVEQLVLIKDVTDEIVDDDVASKSYEEQKQNRDAKIEEIQNKYADETGLICNVTRLFNGGKYSLYGYKHYDDVRAVLFVERIVGLYGGDPDNYTYPRYNSDFALLRVYDENGKPLKSPNYYKFNTEGPKEDEVLFTIGNPGQTNRLKTIAQLEYSRDVSYFFFAWYNSKLLQLYTEMMKDFPDNAVKYQGAMFSPANMAKRFEGFLKGLRDPYIMARKADFENAFKQKILSNPETSKKYGHIWDAIKSGREELTKTAGENMAFQIIGSLAPQYFRMGKALYDLAEELKKPEDERGDNYKGDKLVNTINSIYPDEFDFELQRRWLGIHIDMIIMLIGEEHPVVQKYFGDKTGIEAADYLLSKTLLTSKDNVISIANRSPEDILNCGDPFISYFADTHDRVSELRPQRSEIYDTEEVLEDQLGIALFEIYGTSIPPDATFSLRISDGMMKGYNYNGTVAPTFTTFYGLYDRYLSHKKTWPWDLPDRWVNYGQDFNLGAMNNFVATFDIVGGSSGSAIINKNAEYVGIIHDYNIEGSFSCDFLYSSEKNRAVALSSAGIFEIVKNLFHASRIVKELVSGKIAGKY